MTKEQALQLLREVVEQVRLTYADHQQVQQALSVLARDVAVARAEAKAEAKKD